MQQCILGPYPYPYYTAMYPWSVSLSVLYSNVSLVRILIRIIHRGGPGLGGYPCTVYTCYKHSQTLIMLARTLILAYNFCHSAEAAVLIACTYAYCTVTHHFSSADSSNKTNKHKASAWRYLVLIARSLVVLPSAAHLAAASFFPLLISLSSAYCLSFCFPLLLIPVGREGGGGGAAASSFSNFSARAAAAAAVPAASAAVLAAAATTTASLEGAQPRRVPANLWQRGRERA